MNSFIDKREREAIECFFSASASARNWKFDASEHLRDYKMFNRIGVPEMAIPHRKYIVERLEKAGIYRRRALWWLRRLNSGAEALGVPF